VCRRARERRRHIEKERGWEHACSSSLKYSSWLKLSLVPVVDCGMSEGLEP
jgi:hypothetical protein